MCYVPHTNLSTTCFRLVICHSDAASTNFSGEGGLKDLISIFYVTETQLPLFQILPKVLSLHPFKLCCPGTYNYGHRINSPAYTQSIEPKCGLLRQRGTLW